MIGNILVALVALIHCYIVYLEMVAWDTPTGHRAFNLTPEFAKASKVLAANRGSITAFSPLACFGASISAKPAGN
jgi:putative membrane protein